MEQMEFLHIVSRFRAFRNTEFLHFVATDNVDSC